MTQSWEWIDRAPLEKLSGLPSESKSVIVVSTSFNATDKLQLAQPLNYELTDNSVGLLTECARLLQFGGLLFVYGLPHQLAFFGQHLSSIRNDKMEMLFKYWLTLDIDDVPRGDSLKPTSQGLLMFLKSKAGSRSPSPFHLNTSTVRTPHAYCTACGQNVKDWGGKKHLMNPKGTSLSDVWRDLPKIQIQNHITPDFVLERIFALTKQDGANHLHVVQNKAGVEAVSSPTLSVINSGSDWPHDEWAKLTALELNEVYQGECISFLDKVSALHPQGVFDMAFADPPYNLSKSYDKYNDALAEEHYIEWCNQWLAGMVKTLKPGGSLFVLNLPKWAIHHAAYLNRHLEFRHWITWDALSDPRGKIMPAHYALLYYTKPGAQPIFNYSTVEQENGKQIVLPPDSPKYCLRASCIKKRKRLNDNKKVELSDVWFDIHRIKHKRDRDAHPCQLPEKLMERLVLLTTNRGGLVFDPFCGAGTTAIAASKLGRDFVVVDIDHNYVRIAQEKLIAMKRHADMFGVFTVPRQAVKKTKVAASKKEIETYLQKLARQLGKEPSEEDIASANPNILQEIDLVYPTRLAAIKRCRVVLRDG
jgi:site-specific DNA-methyltransferase (adenine-specific)